MKVVEMPDEQGSANQRPEHDPLRDDDDLGGNRQPGPGEPPRASAADLGQPAADLGQPADEHRASGHDHLGASHTSPLGQPPFGTSGAYGQPGTYGQFGGYGQPGAYGEFRGYGQPGAYGQFGGYGQPGAYGQFGGYGQPPPPAPRPRRRRNIITYLAVAVVAAAIGASATGYALDGTGSSASGGTQSSGPSGGGGIFPGLPGSGNSRNSGGSGNAGRSVSSATISAVEQKIRPALVDISSNLGYQGSQAAATGMIISSNGIVLTNNHVITDTTQLYATLVDGGRRYTARWLGYDASADVAVIQLVGAHNLPTVSLGNSSAVRLGQPVIALGNANGQGGAPAAAGTITALDRTITANDSGAGTSETLHGMLQTDADIVPGDSGGALASTSGQVIGMNTAAATAPFNTAQNRGFAIPIDTAIQIARKIISGHGGAGIQIGSTGFLGVLVPAGQASQTSNPRQQRQLQLQQDENGSGFPVQPSTPACLPNDLTAGVPARVAPVSSGALIIGELCGTPADKAGLIAGDVITAVGRQKVTSPQDLTGVMHGFRPGNTVQVTWVDTAGQVHHSAMALVQAPPR